MNARIMIVDDDYTFAEYLRLVLSSSGCEVFSCEDPLQAGDLAARERPDLVLLDLVMPQMSGLEVLLWLKEKPETSHIPVVVCSVNMDRKVAREVAALGGVDVLTKPVTKAGILDCLRRTLAPSAG